jgi:hypothetical protein
MFNDICENTYHTFDGWDSSVGIATGYRGFDPRKRHEIFLYSTASRQVMWLTQTPTPKGIKRPKRESDRSPPPSVKA